MLGTTPVQETTSGNDFSDEFLTFQGLISTTVLCADVGTMADGSLFSIIS
jgi:hypothetical protein